MGKIVISMSVSLDGVVQDPDGQEGFGRGGWIGQIEGRPGGPWTNRAPTATTPSRGRTSPTRTCG